MYIAIWSKHSLCSSHRIHGYSIQNTLCRLADNNTPIDHFHILDSIHLDFLVVRLIRDMTGICDRYLPPFFVGRNWHTLVLKRLKLFVCSLRIDATLSYDQRRDWKVSVGSRAGLTPGWLHAQIALASVEKDQ